MEIVHCPNCHERVQVPEEYFGKNVVCPKCQNAFTAQAAELPDTSRDYVSAEVSPPNRVRKHPNKGLLQKRRLTDDEYQDVDISLPASQQPPAPILESRMINAGAAGGLALIIVAVAWFVIGLAAGVIFYYPPILFVIGLVAMLKGAVSRN
ncbi:MAG: zinc-ribbon domain-containing protein [Gemmataceae bacterium]|nr:zinc-ribbon domain-containing protein [Gemmataceae bacterium]